MNYLPLSEHKKAWIFKRQDLPISEADAVLIKPMTEPRATTLWKGLISKQVDHPDFFKKGDWPFDINTWNAQSHWEAQWDSGDTELPSDILAHLNWDEHTVVYYCNSEKSVIETTWPVFKRCWKNFLFMDDGALLIGKKRKQVVQFLSNGSCQLGERALRLSLNA